MNSRKPNNDVRYVEHTEGKNLTIEATLGGAVIGRMTVTYSPMREGPDGYKPDFKTGDLLGYLKDVKTRSSGYRGVLYINRVRVEENHRGQGVAAEMYRMAKKHATSLGLPLVSDVTLSNDARALWERRVSEGRATRFNTVTDAGDAAVAYAMK